MTSYVKPSDEVNLPETGYSYRLESEWEAEAAVDETGRPVGNLFPRRPLVPG